MARSRRIFGKGAKPPEGSGRGFGGLNRTKRISPCSVCQPFSAASASSGRSPGKMANGSLPSKVRRADDLARQRMPMMHGSVSPSASHSRLAGGADRGQRHDVDLGAGEIRRAPIARPASGEDRLQPVMARVMQMVGLGRGEQDAVDARRERARARSCARRRGRQARIVGQRASRDRATAAGPAFSAVSASTSTICRSSRAKWSRKNGRTTCVL